MLVCDDYLIDIKIQFPIEVAVKVAVFVHNHQILDNSKKEIVDALFYAKGNVELKLPHFSGFYLANTTQKVNCCFQNLN